VCLTTLVLIEIDFDRFEVRWGRTADIGFLNCPYCGNRLRLVGDFEVIHPTPADG
jgi:hypothetical protein